jgi:hypothetical protein
MDLLLFDVNVAVKSFYSTASTAGAVEPNNRIGKKFAPCAVSQISTSSMPNSNVFGVGRFSYGRTASRILNWKFDCIVRVRI